MVLRTDWYKRNGSADTFLNADDKGPHSPGPTSVGSGWNTAILASRTWQADGADGAAAAAGSSGNAA